MDAGVKAKWLEALRSGEYEQTTGALRSTNGYCCLGVLCEVAVKNDVIPEGVAADEDVEVTTYYYAEAGSWLPDVVAQWAGLDEGDPGVDLDNAADDHYEGEKHYTLSSLNDLYGYDFEMIAGVIETHL